MSILTFDWAQIAYLLSPLATPWWAQANILAGFVFFFWFITPILYFTNTWYAQYLPILSSHAFDNTGEYYNVTRILTPGNTLDHVKYEAYSPLFLPTVFAMSYGLSFASVCATLTHAFLYFRKQIWVQSRRSLSETPDIHARLMSKYQEVPDWWYGVILLSMTVFAIISIEAWPSQLPVWALILALLIAFIYVVPIGIIQAITKCVILCAPVMFLARALMCHLIQSSSWAERHYRTHHWLRPSRSPGRNDDVQDLGLHRHVSGTQPRIRL